MKLNCRTSVAAVALISAGSFARPALAVQNWFGYGGVFGPQTHYTFYAPPPVHSGHAPSPVVSYSVPTAYPAPDVVTSVSGPNLVLPTVAFAPVTTYAPATSCYSMGCGGAVCGPATLAPVPAPLVVPAPAATILQPAPAPLGTPIYPPPGVYPAPPAVTFPPTRTPELPTSSTTAPADIPPTMSGFAPFDARVAEPMNASTPTSPAATTTNGATPQAPANDRLQPNLDISVPEDPEESLVPVERSDAKSRKDAPTTDAEKTNSDADGGPRLEPEEGNTASTVVPRPRLLAPATWRAARPAAKRPAARITDSAWRPATQGK